VSEHGESPEIPQEADDPTPIAGPEDANLLDLLLYKGVLPRYAFPTDVASFYVFDPTSTSPARPKFLHTPQQGLAIALSQYAPGKEVWIASQRYTSGAIYSPGRDDRFDAWQERRLYYECSNCGYAITRRLSQGERGTTEPCPACAAPEALGPARYWLRPPGFAHPVDLEAGTSADEAPARSYPTSVSDAIRRLSMRKQLLVTNTGPRGDG
jgi:hypothetical protein